MLHAVFNALFDQKVYLEGMLLKPNMVISGKECAKQATVEEVALPHCAVCAGMCRLRFRESSSFPADKITSPPPGI